MFRHLCCQASLFLSTQGLQKIQVFWYESSIDTLHTQKFGWSDGTIEDCVVFLPIKLVASEIDFKLYLCLMPPWGYLIFLDLVIWSVRFYKKHLQYVRWLGGVIQFTRLLQLPLWFQFYDHCCLQASLWTSVLLCQRPSTDHIKLYILADIINKTCRILSKNNII